MFNMCEGSFGNATKIYVGEGNVEIVDSFRFLGDVISCGGGVESAVRDILCLE